MNPRASAIALGALAVGATAAGLVLPRLSEQQLQDVACAAFGAVVLAVIATLVATSDRSLP
ncbi:MULTISPECIES: hypothetical protein [Myxococcus]|uniref:hypothetical protein n=1 Tax=Myxococcus TaxID=32 RepID=UPI0011448212|nr:MULTISPECIES: hypothetical protein [Myxococcus]NOK06214.1 hypothetical protein [Myxococcus xanthus]